MPLVYAAGFAAELIAVAVGAFIVSNGGPATNTLLYIGNVFGFGRVLGLAAGRRSAR